MKAFFVKLLSKVEGAIEKASGRCLLILAVVLVLMSCVAGSVFAAGSDEVRGFTFLDGSVLAFQCQKGTTGLVKVMFINADKSAEPYMAVINCGTSV